MASKQTDFLNQFNPARVILPVLLGLGIVAYVVHGELTQHEFSLTEISDRVIWTPRAWLFLALGAAMLVLRDLGYIWQLRILADQQMSWTACFQVVVLWNFFAAVSPSVIGGAAVAVFMLVREKLSIGRSTAIVFTTVFLDQVFYTTIPLYVSLLIPQDDIFAPLHQMKSELLGTSAVAAFWSAWSTLLLYVLFLIAALFVAPGWIHGWLVRLLKLRCLMRWHELGSHIAHDLLVASRDLRRRSLRFWVLVWTATSLAWLGRYGILNCVLAAFSTVPMSIFDHVLALGRQTVLWVLMVVSPTPGGAGVAELGFSWLFRDLAPNGQTLTLALLWRLISYYPYLILGIPVMTHWIKRTYGHDVRGESA